MAIDSWGNFLVSAIRYPAAACSLGSLACAYEGLQPKHYTKIMDAPQTDALSDEHEGKYVVLHGKLTGSSFDIIGLELKAVVCQYFIETAEVHTVDGNASRRISPSSTCYTNKCTVLKVASAVLKQESGDVVDIDFSQGIQICNPSSERIPMPVVGRERGQLQRLISDKDFEVLNNDSSRTPLGHNSSNTTLSSRWIEGGTDVFISGKVKKLAEGKFSIGPTGDKNQPYVISTVNVTQFIELNDTSQTLYRAGAVVLGAMAVGLYYFQKK